MKTQHTPGPWRHVTARLVTNEETQGYHVEDFFRDGKYLGPDCDGIYPAIIDDALANTRLIAAAPETAAERDEFRKLGKEMHDILATMTKQYGAFDAVCQRFRTACLAADRAAITKATA
jgi:hypothetical protein